MSNHDLIRLIRFSRTLQVNYAISYLFRLDLILYACKILVWCDKFRILNFATKQDLVEKYALSSFIRKKRPGWGRWKLTPLDQPKN